MNKVCYECNEEKPMIDFCFCAKRGGYLNLCKKCKNSRVDSDNKKIRKAQGKYKNYSQFILK